MSGYRGARFGSNEGQGHGSARGRGRGHHHGNWNRNEGYERSNSGQDYGGRGEHRGHRGQGHRGGRPPGLRGKEIGMYYARKSKANKEKHEFEQRPLVALGGKQERQIEKLLHSINTADDVAPQPAQSYATVETMDEGDSLSTEAAEETPKVIDPAKSWHVSGFEPQFALESLPLESAVKDELTGEATGSTEQNWNKELPSSSDQGEELPSSTCQGDVTDAEETTVPDLEEMMKYTEEEIGYVFKDDMKDDYFSFSRKRDPDLDCFLDKDFERKQSNQNYRKMMDFRQNLPSFNMVEEILSTVNSNQVTVISGETGCGKTTQVPQFILDDYITRGMGSMCRIMCTQPRRISAVSVAERVADERAEKCGQGNSVGYSIRLERKSPRSSGSVLFCTTGIMLKYLEFDPLLLRATHVILDEIHERDLQSDFMMIILKDILPRRPELKVILMSATLNAQMFSQYFNNCPMLNIPGFTYPVKEYLLEDVIEMTKFMPKQTNRKPKRIYGRKRLEIEEKLWNLDAWTRQMAGKYSPSTLQVIQNMDMEQVDVDLMAALIKHICLKMEDGAILAFVPGWGEISKLNKLLLADIMFSPDKFLILPLHSLMPTINQREVFDTPPPGVRKIIIATNIAETSITINDVVHVVDCGKIKVKDYIPELHLTTLESQWVSKANAKQRRGRAGRVQPGNCFHLYTSLQELEMRDYLPPEMLRTRLEELCLQIKLLKFGKIEPFINKAMQKPSIEALHKAIITLQDLRALDHDENLLPLGYHLARMPVDPHSGKMILFGAMFSCLDPICTVAASLSFKDAFVIPLGKEAEADRARRELGENYRSDHLMLINAFDGWERAKSRGNDSQYCWKYFLSGFTLKLLRDMKKQFAELLYELGFVKSKDPKDPRVNQNSNNAELVKAVICAGLYPNVAKITKIGRGFDTTPKLQLKDPQIRKSAIHPKSVNAKEKQFDTHWMVYHKLMKTANVYVFDTTMVSPYPLLFFGGDVTTGVDVSHPEYHGNYVMVDNWIKFWASPKTATLVNELRRELDKILEDKITKPGMTNWDPKSKEGAVMRAIIDLITTEDIQHKYGGNKADDSY